MHTILLHLRQDVLWPFSPLEAQTSPRFWFLSEGVQAAPIQAPLHFQICSLCWHEERAYRKIGPQGLPKPWEKSRAVRVRQLASEQSLQRKGTFKRLVYLVTSLFNPTNSQVLPFPHYSHGSCYPHSAKYSELMVDGIYYVHVTFHHMGISWFTLRLPSCWAIPRQYHCM